jgi:hypothetical protein
MLIVSDLPHGPHRLRDYGMALGWQPRGNFMTTVQQLSQRYKGSARRGRLAIFDN